LYGRRGHTGWQGKTRHPDLLPERVGYGPDADVEQSRAAGCDHHLVKPVDAADILRLLARSAEPSA
jgi:hypothetical protein